MKTQNFKFQFEECRITATTSNRDSEQTENETNGVVGGGPKNYFSHFFPTTKTEHKREKGNKYKRERKTRGPWVG